MEEAASSRRRGGPLAGDGDGGRGGQRDAWERNISAAQSWEGTLVVLVVMLLALAQQQQH